MQAELLTINVPGAVYVIWWVVLAIAVLIVVPLALYLLQRTLGAARHIERYFAETLASGAVIAESTSAEPALNDTIAVASGMLETAGAIEQKAGAAAGVLVERAS
jgi:hypothetical protein